MNNRVLLSCNVKATGLNPKEVAEHGQPIQIYHPQSQKYIMIDESSPKLAENESNFVCLDENYKGGGKLFLLKHLGNDEYNIWCLDNDGNEKIGLLYVSESVSSGILEPSANVLKSGDFAHKKEQYVFQFIRHSEQKGVYQIRCKGNAKILFGSDDKGKSYVKADKRDREKLNQIWFQLSMKPHMDINSTVVHENRYVLSGSDDPPIYIDEFHNDTTYGYTQPCQDGIKMLVDLLEKTSLNKDQSLKADSSLLASTTNCSPIFVKPRKQMSICSAMRLREQLTEQQLNIEYQGKNFEGYKVLKISAGSTSISIKEDEKK